MTVRMDRGKFVINGKDTFLYGGEFHYFRVPKSEWRDRLQKVKEAGCNLVSTYVPWSWHEPEEGHIDVTGETRDERDLCGFLELVKEFGLYCIVRPGPYVMAEIRYHGIPLWLIEGYPQIISKKQDGSNNPTSTVIYRHPLFLEKVRTWYEAVNRIIAPAQSTNGGTVIMYQLCNEIGMFHWVTNAMDFSGTAIREFAVYLKETYGSIGTFRAKHGVADESFEAFAQRFAEGLTPDDPSFHFEWGYFWRSYIKDYVDDLRRMALETGIDVPFIINIHGFKDVSVCSRGTDYPIGVSQLCRTAEFDDVVLAGDFYPGHVGYDTYHDLVLASEFTRAVSAPDQPLFSAEFQSGRLSDRPRLYPQDLDLNTRTVVAHGMNAVNYYMFAGGVNPEYLGLFGIRHEWQAPIDSKGGLRPNYEKAQHLGRMFAAIGEELVNARKKSHTFIGFMPDDYMTESIDGRDRPLLGEMIGKREHFMFDGVARLLTAANIHYEAVDLRKELDAEAVPTLWVFSVACMDGGLQDRLASYVKNGGKLVLYPQIPVKDLKGEPCTLLKDSLQLGEWELVGGVDTVDVMGIESVNIRQRLRFITFEGEPVAAFTRGGANETAAYRKQAGRGEIIMLGIAMQHQYDYQLDVIGRIAKLIGVEGHLHSTNPYLSLVERTDGEQSFYFINNYDEMESRAVIYEHANALFGGTEIVLPPRTGALLLRNYRIADGVTVAYATAECTGIQYAEHEILLSLQPVGGQGKLLLELGEGWSLDTSEQTINPDGSISISESMRVRLTR